MTISANGPMAAADGPNGGLGLANGPSFYYREVTDKRQLADIRAAGKQFAELTDGQPCLALIGQLLGVTDPKNSTERRIQKKCFDRVPQPLLSPPARGLPP